jgi:hypothetical protein
MSNKMTKAQAMEQYETLTKLKEFYETFEEYWNEIIENGLAKIRKSRTSNIHKKYGEKLDGVEVHPELKTGVVDRGEVYLFPQEILIEEEDIFAEPTFFYSRFYKILDSEYTVSSGVGVQAMTTGSAIMVEPGVLEIQPGYKLERSGSTWKIVSDE